MKQSCGSRFIVRKLCKCDKSHCVESTAWRIEVIINITESFFQLKSNDRKSIASVPTGCDAFPFVVPLSQNKRDLHLIFEIKVTRK